MSKVIPKDVQGVIDALEVGSYHMYMDPVTQKIFDTLCKLKLSKMPKNITYGAPLQIEDLDATLKSVTFDDSKIKLHKNLGKKK